MLAYCLLALITSLPCPHSVSSGFNSGERFGSHNNVIPATAHNDAWAVWLDPRPATAPHANPDTSTATRPRTPESHRCVPSAVARTAAPRYAGSSPQRSPAAHCGRSARRRPLLRVGTKPPATAERAAGRFHPVPAPHCEAAESGFAAESVVFSRAGDLVPGRTAVASTHSPAAAGRGEWCCRRSRGRYGVATPPGAKARSSSPEDSRVLAASNPTTLEQSVLVVLPAWRSPLTSSSARAAAEPGPR